MARRFSNEHRGARVRRRRHPGRYRGGASPRLQPGLRGARTRLALGTRRIQALARGHGRQGAADGLHRQPGPEHLREEAPARAGAGAPCREDAPLHRHRAAGRPRVASRRGAPARRGDRRRAAPGDRQHHDRGEHRRLAAGDAGPGRPVDVRRDRLRRPGARQEARARHLPAGARHHGRGAGAGDRRRGLGQRTALGTRRRPVDAGHADLLDRRRRLQRRRPGPAEPGRPRTAARRRAGRAPAGGRLARRRRTHAPRDRGADHERRAGALPRGM